jgi:acyl carrier protein
MELEVVELIMAVEEEFRVEIPDRIVEGIVSIGQLGGIVEAELRRRDRDVDASIVMRRIADIAAYFGGVTPASVRPETTLIEDLGLK